MRTERNTRRKRRKKPFQKLGIYGTLAAAIAVAGLIGTACSKEASVGDAKVSSMTESIVIETTPIEITTAPESIPPLEPGGQLLPNIAITVPEVEPMPEYIRVGDRHSAVVNLQSRLMELGFMDSDEPTDYYGTQTERAVKIFQRQNKLAMDGIVGSATYDAIMDPAAKYYAVRKGDEGDDISQLQNRLYELGYLATADLITGNFGDSTEAAVLKLQEVNSLEADGMVGQKTMNLLYSDEIRPISFLMERRVK